MAIQNSKKENVEIDGSEGFELKDSSGSSGPIDQCVVDPDVVAPDTYTIILKKGTTEVSKAALVIKVNDVKSIGLEHSSVIVDGKTVTDESGKTTLSKDGEAASIKLSAYNVDITAVKPTANNIVEGKLAVDPLTAPTGSTVFGTDVTFDSDTQSLIVPADAKNGTWNIVATKIGDTAITASTTLVVGHAASKVESIDILGSTDCLL